MYAPQVIFLALMLIGSFPISNAEEKTQPMTVKKITPVLLVQEIEPCLKFWVDRLGFEKISEVPDGNRLAFVILQKGNAELMYQTYASAEKDNPAIAQEMSKGPTFLYVEVEKLNDIISAIKGAQVVLPERTTFYGAREIGVRDPAGHVVVFAEFDAQAQH